MIVPNGATDVTRYFVLRDSTNHAPKTDVTVTDIDLYYVEEGAAISGKADVTALAAADSAHADNKGFHVGQGLYRIDWPDEAFNGGVGKHVILIVVCSGVDTTFLEVELSPSVDVGAVSGDTTAADNAESFFDGTGYAGTNNVIPTVTNVTNAVALPTGTGAGQISLTSGGVLVDSIKAGAVNAGAIATDAIDADALKADAATEIGNAVLALLSNIDGYSFIEVQRLLLAGQVGKVAGAGTTTVTIRDAADTKDRITATVDAYGNRDAVAIVET